MYIKHFFLADTEKMSTDSVNSEVHAMEPCCFSNKYFIITLGRIYKIHILRSKTE